MICLALNVKNEEDAIARCIRSALPHVDCAVIVDTGCTDNTLAEAREALGDLPTAWYEAEWEGHAHNRTHLLALARESGADYTLMLDADMTVEGTFPQLTHDEYQIDLHDRSLVYALPLLTSTRKVFSYHGVAHSYLACAEPITTAKLDGVFLKDHGGGPGKDGKFERDAALLAAEVAKNPADRRSWYYLGQTYRDLDRIPEAIAAYRMRASLGGWDEEVYNALYQAGKLLCAHVSYAQGAPLLLEAWNLMPHRAEALRALSGASNGVANKMAFPDNDVLFVEPSAYVGGKPEPKPVMPLLPSIGPRKTRKPRIQNGRLRSRDVTAIVVTRGNVDLDPIMETLQVYDQTIVWNNSERPHDYKVFGRYAAIPEAWNPVIYWQDDDIIFTAHDELLAAYQPGKIVANMDQAWVDGAGYGDFLAMVGAGSLCDAHLPAQTFARYLKAGYEFDDDVLLEADFLFGTMTPFTRVDLGYQVRDFADDPDRLYLQPGQTERKHRIIGRGRELVAA